MSTTPPTIDLATMSDDELAAALRDRANTPPDLPASGTLFVRPAHLSPTSALRSVMERAASQPADGWRVLLMRGGHQLFPPLRSFAATSAWSQVNLSLSGHSSRPLHLLRVPTTVTRAVQQWYHQPPPTVTRVPLPHPDAVADLGDPDGPWRDQLALVLVLAQDMPLDAVVEVADRLTQ